MYRSGRVNMLVTHPNTNGVGPNFLYLTHVIEQPIFLIPNLEYLQQNFCFDFFNDSENTFWGFFEI